MKYTQLTILLLAFGCATPNVQMMTQEQVTTQKIVNHKLSKKQSFAALKSFLAKSLVNSNYSIRNEDFSSGSIMAKFVSVCPSGGMVDATIEYDLDIDFKDKKSRLTIVSNGSKMYSYISKEIELSPLGYSEEFYKSTKLCREQILEKFVEQLKAPAKNDDW